MWVRWLSGKELPLEVWTERVRSRLSECGKLLMYSLVISLRVHKAFKMTNIKKRTLKEIRNLQDHL
jgi:hypothetical protein